MPSASDRFEGEHCFIITNPSKSNFHLYGNDPDEIKIRDIANAISKQCRFTGHLEEDYWYSVAEHCVDTSFIIERMGGTIMEQFCGLMHDTPEGYLSDINAPFKREIGQYYEKEALIWKRIAEKFGMPLELPAIVKAADWIALFVEARTFVAPGRPEIMKGWIGYDPHGIKANSDPFDRYQMQGLGFRAARVHFLNRFEELQDALRSP